MTVLSARVSVRVVEPSAFWVTSVLTPELPEDEPPELPPEDGAVTVSVPFSVRISYYSAQALRSVGAVTVIA